ncbi:MAG: hypothetical protein IKJ31_08190 [Bacteroidaceae bacterium]|nr:hypothetical protein [Bacteroidaceae bacterium]
MKKAFYLFMLLLVVVTACENGPKRLQLMNENDSLQNVIHQRDAALDEMITSINIIEEGFRTINEAQGRVNLDMVGSEKSKSDKLLEDIAFISSTLAKNKEQIELLQKQLEKSKSGSKQLKVMVENLQKQLNEKSLQVQTLQTALAQKNIHIEELDKTIAELKQAQEVSERVISLQESELNSVWYAIGTKRELKGENILSGGDVLREANANMDYFTKADMRELKSINTYAKSAKLLTSHPESSYNMVRDENKMYTLNIIDPVAFWSVSRYLVIQVK